MSNNRWDIDEIENLGRLAAPSLSPQLRERTLRQCAQMAHQKQRRLRQRGWALISIFAAVCLLHWASISALNASAGLPPATNISSSSRFAMTPDEYQKLLQQRAAWMTLAEADTNVATQQSR